MAPVSSCVLFLSSIIIIQFMLIYHLSNQCPLMYPDNDHLNGISQLKREHAIIESAPLPIVQENKLALISNCNTSNSNGNNNSNNNAYDIGSTQSLNNAPRKYAGIALTLMLHTPTWFQRRYSMMVFNIINNLPADWALQIVTTGKGQSKAGIDINLGLKRLVESGKVLNLVLPESMSKIKRFELMLTRFIWENIPADKVLIFGGNQVICSNSPFQISDFIKFDYIGAPWEFRNGQGGEGGISLRSRSMMLAALDYELGKVADPEKRKKAHLTWGQEDQFYVSRLIEMRDKNVVMPEYPGVRFSDVKIASREDTRSFASTNSYVNNTAFTCAGTLGSSTFEERDLYISFCPEIKMVFPSLHDPSCFGASPNGTECAKTICALKVPRRKGGC